MSKVTVKHKNKTTYIGPYVEFELTHINPKVFNLVTEVPHSYYKEWRSETDNVKAYFQLKTVDYADYKIGRIYISPFDLYDNAGKALITKKRGVNNK